MPADIQLCILIINSTFLQENKNIIGQKTIYKSIQYTNYKKPSKKLK